MFVEVISYEDILFGRSTRSCVAMQSVGSKIYVNSAYNMKATFVELSPFERNRRHYLDDEAFRLFQQLLLTRPDAGDVIAGTGGLRKVRFGDPRRGKGRRGGLRVIYYCWLGGAQFWLFTLYDKDEQDDLNERQRNQLAVLLQAELKLRGMVR